MWAAECHTALTTSRGPQSSQGRGERSRWWSQADMVGSVSSSQIKEVVFSERRGFEWPQTNCMDGINKAIRSWRAGFWWPWTAYIWSAMGWRILLLHHFRGGGSRGVQLFRDEHKLATGTRDPGPLCGLSLFRRCFFQNEASSLTAHIFLSVMNVMRSILSQGILGTHILFTFFYTWIAFK